MLRVSVRGIIFLPWQNPLLPKERESLEEKQSLKNNVWTAESFPRAGFWVVMSPNHLILTGRCPVSPCDPRRTVREEKVSRKVNKCLSSMDKPHSIELAWFFFFIQKYVSSIYRVPDTPPEAKVTESHAATFCHSGVHAIVGLPAQPRNQRRHTWEQERYLVTEWWRACSRISKHGLEWGSWDFGMRWEMGARKTFSRNWAETKYGKVYLFTSRGPKSVTEAELQLRKVPAGPRAALRDSCFIQHCAAGEVSRRWNGGSQNLCRDKWHCDFPWHPLKFLTNFQKYLVFALKQPVGLRHFSWNTSEKQSNPSHLSVPSPNRPDRERLTYWRPT